jgi:hypothetical protein
MFEAFPLEKDVRLKVKLQKCKGEKTAVRKKVSSVLSRRGRVQRSEGLWKRKGRKKMLKDKKMLGQKGLMCKDPLA